MPEQVERCPGRWGVWPCSLAAGHPGPHQAADDHPPFQPSRNAARPWYEGHSVLFWIVLVAGLSFFAFAMATCVAAMATYG